MLQAKQAQQAANAEMRINILSQILLPAAQDRLKRLQLVRPEKVRAVEDSLLMAAKSGKLKEKISEEQLIQFLGQLDGTIDADGAPKVGRYILFVLNIPHYFASSSLYRRSFSRNSNIHN